jgi:hypothetical protein
MRDAARTPIKQETCALKDSFRRKSARCPTADAVELLKPLDAARIGKFIFRRRSNLKPIAHWACWELVQRLNGREAGDRTGGVAAGLPRLVPVVVHRQTCPHRGRRALPRARAGGRDRKGLRPRGDAGGPPRVDGEVDEILERCRVERRALEAGRGMIPIAITAEAFSAHGW